MADSGARIQLIRRRNQFAGRTDRQNLRVGRVRRQRRERRTVQQSSSAPKRHPTLFKVLSVVGLGRGRVVSVPADAQGRIRSDALPALSGPTTVTLGRP
jgi:hypothetical protein